MTTAYDTVPYPSLVHAHTHPDRLATLATLYGMDPAPPEDCRLLELGCGDGTNLIVMGANHPRSRFVGIDLAAAPIAAGQARLRQLGVENVTLRQADVAELSAAALGPFDYIVAHGFYSWVPPAVRDAALAFCGAGLSPNGVAFVSYNAYPGFHFRQMVGQMMAIHAERFAAPDARVREARAVLQFLADARAAGTGPAGAPADLYGAALRKALHFIADKPDTGLYHDDLASINQPVYFHEFAAHARRHGLQYLADVEYARTADHGLAPPVRQQVRQLAGGDVIALEQYADFVRGRSFRMTLLCRPDVALDRPPRAERVRRLYARAPAPVVKPPATPAPSARPAVSFAGPNESVFTTSDPMMLATLQALGDSWPRPLHFDELLAAVEPRLPREAVTQIAGGVADALARTVLSLYEVEMLDLRSHRPRIAARPSDRPAVSPLARRQAESGFMVTDLVGHSVRLEGPAVRRLVQLLDGTRDRTALMKEITPLMPPGQLTPERLEGQLNELARLALLTD